MLTPTQHIIKRGKGSTDNAIKLSLVLIFFYAGLNSRDIIKFEFMVLRAATSMEARNQFFSGFGQGVVLGCFDRTRLFLNYSVCS